jgi:hypothetical protein
MYIEMIFTMLLLNQPRLYYSLNVNAHFVVLCIYNALCIPYTVSHHQFIDVKIFACFSFQ